MFVFVCLYGCVCMFVFVWLCLCVCMVVFVCLCLYGCVCMFVYKLSLFLVFYVPDFIIAHQFLAASSRVSDASL